ncbi:MAG: SPOR domain-containing protein [Pseudomonadota bacterium]
MESKLRQRVTGAIVLTALAIIILPMLFDGNAEERARLMTEIPEPPVIALRELSVDDISSRMAAMESASTEAIPQVVPDLRDYAETTAPEEFALDANRLPVSWSLQLGSFTDYNNALALRETMRNAEYRTYIIQAQTDEGETYRVLIGPMVQRAELSSIADEIARDFDIQGQIVRYRLEDDAGQLGG